jgi:acetolactate synthase-1/3 small subunit/acetolactate synthase II small subunit
MVNQRLVVSFTPAEGAVVRMLGLVERRGYAVRRVNMEERIDGASMTIDLEPRDPARRVDVVARQLHRLVDVKSVSIVTQNQGSLA